jgi:hypothetical protein
VGDIVVLDIKVVLQRGKTEKGAIEGNYMRLFGNRPIFRLRHN